MHYLHFHPWIKSRAGSSISRRSLVDHLLKKVHSFNSVYLCKPRKHFDLHPPMGWVPLCTGAYVALCLCLWCSGLSNKKGCRGLWICCMLCCLLRCRWCFPRSLCFFDSVNSINRCSGICAWKWDWNIWNWFYLCFSRFYLWLCLWCLRSSFLCLCCLWSLCLRWWD